MSVALRLYEQLTEAADDKTRARLIAEAFEAVEERFLKEPDTVVDEYALPLLRDTKKLKNRISGMEVNLFLVIHHHTLWRIAGISGVLGVFEIIDHLLK